ncbi:hypothetical protein B0T16DRAFT_441749 [Cercophora newfieldiana]|uniref:Uncharacterized protein n=1 Tax=Cercophora newfieldiana TaxID=92897 RepID=A0AA39YQR7_9PEZI|nr:hypothetical protein B0T16DRAFT_441749 [Cercophora newfieldiana]
MVKENDQKGKGKEAAVPSTSTSNTTRGRPQQQRQSQSQSGSNSNQRSGSQTPVNPGSTSRNLTYAPTPGHPARVSRASSAGTPRSPSALSTRSAASSCFRSVSGASETNPVIQQMQQDAIDQDRPYMMSQAGRIVHSVFEMSGAADSSSEGWSGGQSEGSSVPGSPYYSGTPSPYYPGTPAPSPASRASSAGRRSASGSPAGRQGCGEKDALLKLRTTIEGITRDRHKQPTLRQQVHPNMLLAFTTSRPPCVKHSHSQFSLVPQRRPVDDPNCHPYGDHDSHPRLHSILRTLPGLQALPVPQLVEDCVAAGADYQEILCWPRPGYRVGFPRGVLRDEDPKAADRARLQHYADELPRWWHLVRKYPTMR